MRFLCRQCGKPLKENTQGDPKYCQGHKSSYSFRLEEDSNKDYKESLSQQRY